MRLLSLSLLLLFTTSSLAVEESVNVGQVRCGKVKLKCTMKVSFKCDCSEVIKVTPKCNKKAKCQKVPVSFVTENGCTVTGKFKASGKKYSMSNLEIKPPSTTPTPTNPITTTTTTQSTTTTLETTSITTAEPVWTIWGEWSTCNSSSSQTMMFRHRHCINALTSAACDGEPVETAPCTAESPNQPACQNSTNAGEHAILVNRFVKTTPLQVPRSKTTFITMLHDECYFLSLY